MKQLCLLLFLMTLVIGLTHARAQEYYSIEFPDTIGDYAKTKTENLPLSEDMESNERATYTLPTISVRLNCIEYNDEKEAKKSYENEKQGGGSNECTLQGIKGLCKTTYSYHSRDNAFEWKEGKKVKTVEISRENVPYERMAKDTENRSVEDSLGKDLLLFIEVFKGL